MALFSVKVNGDKEYRILSYNPSSFIAEPKLKLISSDYQSVSDDFSKINKIEIYAGGNLQATYTTYDSMSDSSVLSKEFYEDENRFVDMIEITLVKSNISETVEKIEKQLNPFIDIDSMSVDEYKEYILEQVRVACNNDISDGDFVTLPDGSNEKFTWNMEDQQNILNAVYICDKLVAKGVDLTKIQLPYHSSGQGCKLYPATAMSVVYTTLFIRSIKLQTYCNALNMLIRAAQTKEDLANYHYGVDLPEDVQKQVDELVAATLQLAQMITE